MLQSFGGLDHCLANDGLKRTRVWSGPAGPLFFWAERLERATRPSTPARREADALIEQTDTVSRLSHVSGTAEYVTPSNPGHATPAPRRRWLVDDAMSAFKPAMEVHVLRRTWSFLPLADLEHLGSEPRTGRAVSCLSAFDQGQKIGIFPSYVPDYGWHPISLRKHSLSSRFKQLFPVSPSQYSWAIGVQKA